MSGLFWRLFAAVRSHERDRFLFFLGLFALLTAAQTVGLVGSEALFLGREGPSALPATFVIASVATVLASLAYAALVGRLRNDGLFVALLVGSGILLAGGSFAADLPAAPTVLFCAWFATQAVFQNHYWTFAGDFFDTPTAKRLFPIFTVGASVGGALGGGLAAGAVRVLPTSALLAAWGLLLACAGLWLRAARPKIRRWGPLGFEEADESSVEGLRAALRYARTSPMSRGLVLSALAMVLALFVSQFLYSEAFVAAWPEPEQLAMFFGVFLLVSNFIEVGVEVGLTPALIRRFGLPTANLAHPVVTFLCFGWMFFDFGLYAAVAARANRELLENALAAPVRNLVYNALPLRLRGRMRAFLEGIVVYSGMAIAGGTLLLLGAQSHDPEDVRMLVVAGGVLAVLYLAANLVVRRAYLRALVTELRAGRLDLRDVGDALGGFELTRLAELWRDLLARPDDVRAADAAAELAPLLASHGQIEPLVFAAGHADPRVRRCAVEALGGLEAGREPVLAACRDPDVGVREAAVHALRMRAETDAVARDELRSCLEDAAPTVCAEAALGLGEEGEARLERLMREGEPAPVVAALERLPTSLQWLARERLGDEDPATVAAALACIARVGAASSVPTAEVAELARHEDEAIRAGSIALLADQATQASAAALAGALDDPSRDLRQRAAELLGDLGALAVEPAREQLEQGGLWTRDAALAALGATATPQARRVLVDTLRARAEAAWDHVLSQVALGASTALPERFAFAAHGSAVMDELRICFRVLEHLEGPVVVRSVQRTLRLGSPRARGDALEALSHLGDRAASSLLALLHETGSLEDRIRGDARFADRPRDGAEVLRRARASLDRWIRMAGEAADRDGESQDQMERLLALREVPIFAQLRLDQLESISRMMKEETWVTGEVVMREGDPGHELFLLLEGEVDVWLDWGTAEQRRVNRLTAPTYVGEMAVLADERRTATIVASKDSRLATLAGEQLKELILQMPEISFDVFRELVAAVRRAERGTGS